jgi:N-acyl amino acid synthase FeeM
MVMSAFAGTEGLNDRVLKLLERVDYRRVEAEEEKKAIFHLRYAAYLREGAISPNPSESFSDALDETENVWIFGVYIGAQLASSIRVHVADSGYGTLPALGVFSDLLAPQIKSGKKFIDPTRFVADRVHSRQHPELPYVTVRLAWLASEYFAADILLATVRAEHQAYYRRVFGHRVVCEPRHYPSLAKPISMMCLDYRAAKDAVQRRYPFFRSNHFERRMLFERDLNMTMRTAA